MSSYSLSVSVLICVLVISTLFIFSLRLFHFAFFVDHVFNSDDLSTQWHNIRRHATCIVQPNFFDCVLQNPNKYTNTYTGGETSTHVYSYDQLKISFEYPMICIVTIHLLLKIAPTIISNIKQSLRHWNK